MDTFVIVLYITLTIVLGGVGRLCLGGGKVLFYQWQMAVATKVEMT